MVQNTNLEQRRYRFFNRQSIQARMRFAWPELGGSQQREGWLLNKGEGGVCFQAREYIKPGTRLYLLIEEPDSDEEKSRAGSQVLYLATVRWCQRLQSSQQGAYGVGAKFLSNECEWCGESVPYEQIHFTESRAVLCETCLRDLEDFNNGRLKLSLTNHLLGNVL